MAGDAKVGRDAVARRRGERHRVADRVLAGRDAEEIGDVGQERCLGRVASRAAVAGHEEHPAPVAALPAHLQEPGGFAVALEPALELQAWLAREGQQLAALPAPREPRQELALRECLKE
jgi:hypothetical protein